MSAEELIVRKIAQKNFHKIPAAIHKKLNAALNTIKANPLLGTRLHGELAGFYKFRVGDYRIIYRFDPGSKLVEVMQIEHRQGVYR